MEKGGCMPTVDSAGVPIHYEVIGAGAPILLVHGYLSSFEGNWGQSGWVDFSLSLSSPRKTLPT